MVKNKKLLVYLLIATTLFSMTTLAMPVGASSPTIHVYSGESIQAAVNSALAGSTILVHEGVYNEFVGIGKALNLKGVRATIQQIDGAGNGYAVSMGASGISISGFTIRAWQVAVDAGGDWAGGAITDNSIYSDHVGVGINHPSKLVISHNVVQAVYPVYLYQEASGMTIEQNTLYADVAPGSVGIWTDKPIDAVITHNTIYSNWYGISLLRSDGAIVAHNKITVGSMSSGGEIGIHIYGTRSAVFQNQIDGSFWTGIYIGSQESCYSSFNAVFSNKIVGEQETGTFGVLLVENTHDNTAAKNKILGVETAILDKGINNAVS